MAIAVIETDTWIQHLEFVGGQRQTPYGPVDGLFYGTMAGTGDATGGNFTLNGRLSEERKTDRVYIFGGSHTRVNSEAVPGDVFEQVNTGPLSSTGVASITNPTFESGGVRQVISSNAVSFPLVWTLDKCQGMPMFGDRNIPGVFLMYAAGWEDNVDTVLYSAQLWGWYIRYQGFFRGVSPNLG